jgi:signal transduction histidine kinase
MKQSIFSLCTIFVTSFILAMLLFAIQIYEKKSSFQDQLQTQIELYRDELVSAIIENDTYTIRRFLESVRVANENSMTIEFVGAGEALNSKCLESVYVPISHMGQLLGGIKSCKSLRSVVANIFMSKWFFLAWLFGSLLFFCATMLPTLYYRRLTAKLLRALDPTDGAIKREHLDYLQQDIMRLIDENTAHKIEKVRLTALHDLAAQVSHDIRSPLAALKAIVGGIQVSDERRRLMQGAVSRINDIANSLLQKSKPIDNNLAESDLKNQEHLLLNPLLCELIEEKRFEHSDRTDLKIRLDIGGNYFAFVSIDSSGLKRVLSNLINNAIEAIESQRGEVGVSVKERDDFVQIIVSDTGRGIPPEILSRIGVKGGSFGKSDSSNSGSGLGVYYARKFAEDAGGCLKIESQVGHGTRVILELPIADVPEWYTTDLNFCGVTDVALIGPREKMNKMWVRVTATNNEKPEKIVVNSFENINEFIKWNGQELFTKCVLVLMDLEVGKENLGTDASLLGSKLKGKYVLTEEGVNRNLGKSLLSSGVKVLIAFESSVVSTETDMHQQHYDWVLVDDDNLVHFTWQLTAKDVGKSFRGFTTQAEFLEAAPELKRTSNVFVDVNLKNGDDGVELAKNIVRLGFNNVSVATGYDRVNQDLSVLGIGLLGKSPPVDFQK